MVKSDGYRSREGKTEEDEEEALNRKYAEEILERKTKAGSRPIITIVLVKMAKFQMKKESTIKQVICENCRKSFKTNSNAKFCLIAKNPLNNNNYWH